MDYIATFVDGYTASTLAHYGIKKQKWGVRRFQNPDGTLTEEGRRRYGVGVASRKAYEKSARYKAKSDAYALKSKRAIDRYDQFKSDKMKRKSEEYAAKASSQYAKAVKLENKDDRIVNRKYSESDIYALEGAKRAGLLGAAVGKAVGVYKEHKEAKEKERIEKFNQENAKLESEHMYDFSINDRSKPLAQNVKDTEKHLQSICEAHINRLSEVMKVIPGENPYDSADYLYDGSFATELAYRINERFDVDHILDQRMDEWVHDYRNGLISKKEFKQRYESELNDYAAWAIDTYKLDDLKKVAKTFTDSEGYEPGEYAYTAPNTSWREYLKTVDSWEGVDSNILNRQNSKKSSVDVVANDPKHWRQIESASGERLYERIEPSKSSGRYKTGSKETSDQTFKRLESDPGYIKVKDKSKSGDGGQALVKIEDKATAAVSLSYLGYSDKEIAKMLGVSIESLRKTK